MTFAGYKRRGVGSADGCNCRRYGVHEDIKEAEAVVPASADGDEVDRIRITLEDCTKLMTMDLR